MVSLIITIGILVWSYVHVPELRAFYILYCIVLLYGLVGGISRMGKARPYFLLFGKVILPVLLAIALGYSVASYFITPDTVSSYVSDFLGRPARILVHLRNVDAPLSDRVLGFGDKGMLLYNPTSDRIEFRRWDNLLLLERTRNDY